MTSAPLLEDLVDPDAPIVSIVVEPWQPSPVDGIAIVRLLPAHWTALPTLHQAVAAAFGFPNDYGHNWDALNDCLGLVDGVERTCVIVVARAAEALARAPEAVSILLAIAQERREQRRVRLVFEVASNDAQARGDDTETG